MAIAMFLVYAVIALTSIAVFLIKQRLKYWKNRGIPCDEPHILMGNMAGFQKTKIVQEIWDDIYYKYKGTGPFCGAYFFQRPVALILDTKLAKNVLIKDFSNFADRGVYHNERDDPLTGHLFALDGVKWKILRHKLSPTFTSGKMKYMFPTIVEVGERFVSVFDEMLKTEGEIIDIKELFARFTTDVIGTCAFGIDCNSLKDPEAEFRQKGRLFFEKPRHGVLLTAFMQGCPDLARKLRMRAINEDVHQFFMQAVRETVTYREKNNIKRNDFMDLLIELRNNKQVKMENGEILKGITMEELAAQAFVFFIAGFETSSTASSFALYELARHQDVQDKMRKEINEVFAKHNDKFTYECMQDLHYTEQVFYETLRLYTIVPHLSRVAINDYVVPENPKFVIEKGTMVIVPSSSYHRDPELYPEPLAFKPDRFSPENTANRDSIEWLPFGDGPRNCIGLRFGKMQSRIGLALLLKNFKFTVCDKTPIPMKYNKNQFILGSEGGIYLRVEKV